MKKLFLVRYKYDNDDCNDELEHYFANNFDEVCDATKLRRTRGKWTSEQSGRYVKFYNHLFDRFGFKEIIIEEVKYTEI